MVAQTLEPVNPSLSRYAVIKGHLEHAIAKLIDAFHLPESMNIFGGLLTKETLYATKKGIGNLTYDCIVIAGG
jgi:hypothetical protein